MSTPMYEFESEWEGEGEFEYEGEGEYEAEEFFGFVGFADEVERTAFDCFDRICKRVVACEDDDRQLRCLRFE